MADDLVTRVMGEVGREEASTSCEASAQASGGIKYRRTAKTTEFELAFGAGWKVHLRAMLITLGLAGLVSTIVAYLSFG